MDTAQWPQDTGVTSISRTSYPKDGDHEHNKVARPQKEQGLNCPRCNSTNTKFCYYNNYSLSQPRYFCKTCRRYWTAGGSLRNIPVGGGSRKNKRPSSSSSSSNNNINNSSAKHIKLTAPDPTVHDFSKGFMGSSFMMPTGSTGPVQDPVGPGLGYSTGFDHLPHQFMMKPQSLNFSLDGLGLGSASVGAFPFHDLKQQQAPSSSTQDHDHDHHQNGDMINISSGYWSGMLGGGGGGGSW